MLGGVTNTVFKFDTEANEWSTLARMPVASSHHTATALGGLIYITGMSNSQRLFLRLDPVSDVWETLAPTLTSRFASSIFVLDGSLYVAGGLHVRQTSKTVERYDVASNTWTAVADMLEERKYFGAVTIGSTELAEEQNLFDSLITKAASQSL
jgi:N-acetylneuraminic acid mutarotase